MRYCAGMAGVERLSPRAVEDMPVSPEPVALHARAADNLRFIRETMERAAAFTALSGWGFVTIGATALITSYVAGRRLTERGWLFAWLVEALIAVVIALLTMWRKARRAGEALWSRPGKKLILNAAPPMLAGALLTLFFYRAGLVCALPCVWMLLYGAGVVTGGAFSVRIVPLMGASFMLLGACALGLMMFALSSQERALQFQLDFWLEVLMAIGFGGLHIIFGILIVRRHGG
jgi:uncharacterized membrane protein YiaA